MSDAILASPGRATSRSTLAGRVLALGLAAYVLVREWCRRSRSRSELASYSHEQRADLGYAADLDAEVAKPFWSK